MQKIGGVKGSYWYDTPGNYILPVLHLANIVSSATSK